MRKKNGKNEGGAPLLLHHAGFGAPLGDGPAALKKGFQGRAYFLASAAGACSGACSGAAG